MPSANGFGEESEMPGMMLMMLAATTAAPTCGAVPLTAAVDRYAALSRVMDVRRVAALYAADGVLVGPGGTPISGPGEVARFLSGFRTYKLVDYGMTIDTIAPSGDGWRTEGSYRQHGSDPMGTAFSAKGGFAADWRCTRGGWRVMRMTTVPR